MKEKLVPVIFGIISAAVWAATIALIVFSVVLLATGMERDPRFSVRSCALSRLAPEDEAYRNASLSGNNWYRLTLDMDVASAKYSPYSYSADGVSLRSGGFAADGFRVELDEPLFFSKAEPDAFTLTIFIRYNGDPAALAKRLSECRFRLEGYQGHVAFFDVPFRSSPGFRLADFSTLGQQLSAQAASL